MKLRSTAPLFRVALVVIAVTQVSCSAVGGKDKETAGPNEPTPEFLTALDRLSDIYAEYGSITFATPFLVVPDPDKKYFNFDLPNRGAHEYFDAAKNELQGRAAYSSQQASISSTGLSVQADLDQYSMLSDSLSKFQFDRSRYYRNLALSDQRQQLLDQVKYKVAQDKLKFALDKAKTESDPAARDKTITDALELYAKDIPAAAEVGKYPDYPKPDYTNLPNLDKSLTDLPEGTKQYFKNLQFAERMGLIGGEGAGVAVRDRSALITAAGDTLIEGMLRVLGEADQAVKFKDKKVLYGVSMVTVQPGWRTREGFEANLIVQPRLFYAKARGKENKGPEGSEGGTTNSPRMEGDGNGSPSNKPRKSDQPSGNFEWNLMSATPSPGQNQDFQYKTRTGALPYATPSGNSPHDDPCPTGIPSRPIPTVAVVSPLGDVQNLDLSSSQRQAMEKATRIMLALRFMGINVGFGDFNAYVKKIEQDIRTRTPAIPVTTFATPGAFGYRIAPSLVALANPTDGSGNSAAQLQQQSFPVLVLIGLDDTDLETKRHPNESTTMCEPTIGFAQTVKWVPVSESARNHPLTEQELAKVYSAVRIAPSRAAAEHTARSEEAAQAAFRKMGVAEEAWITSQEATKAAEDKVVAAKAAADKVVAAKVAKAAADQAAKAAADHAANAAAGEEAKVAAKAAADYAAKAAAEQEAAAKAAKAAADEAKKAKSLSDAAAELLDSAQQKAGSAAQVARTTATAAVEAQQANAVELFSFRAESLERLIYGASDWQRIPQVLFDGPPSLPAFSSVAGGPIKLLSNSEGKPADTPAKLVFLGNNLDKLNIDPQNVAIVGKVSEALITQQEANYLLVDITLEHDTGPEVVLRFIRDTDGNEILVPAPAVAVAAPDTPIPTVDKIYAVDVKPSKEDALGGKLIITGNQLDKLDLNQIVVFTLPGTAPGSPKLTNAQLVSGVIQADIETASSGGSFLLRISLKAPDIGLITSPPVVIPGKPVSAEQGRAAVPEKPAVLLQQKGTSSTTTNSIEFQGALTPEQLAASGQLLKAQIEKDKPTATAQPPAPADPKKPSQ